MMFARGGPDIIVNPRSWIPHDGAKVILIVRIISIISPENTKVFAGPRNNVRHQCDLSKLSTEPEPKACTIPIISSPLPSGGEIFPSGVATDTRTNTRRS